jgi:hypothetical protein
MTSDRGVVYVATGDLKYLEEAFLSAESVKRRLPGMSISIFTDRPTHELCASGVFDRVEPAPPAYGIVLGWARGQLARIRGLRRTPYRRTVHLDTDTLLTSGELPWLFDRLERIDVAFVEATPDDSVCRDELGRRMFNAGVIAYRSAPRVFAWLDAWDALSERNFRAAARVRLPALPFVEHIADEGTRRLLLCMDQTSLTELLSPEVNQFGLEVETLPNTWNFRGASEVDGQGRPIHIQHAPRPWLTSRQERVDAARLRTGSVR